MNRKRKEISYFHILNYFSSESEMSDTPCKPVFVQPLLDITINEGQKLKLHAAINAHPEPEVKKHSRKLIYFLKFFLRLFGIVIIFH